MIKPASFKAKSNSRKIPCEICGVGTGSRHNVSCKWAWTPRPSKKAQPNKLSDKQKIEIINYILNS